MFISWIDGRGVVSKRSASPLNIYVEEHVLQDNKERIQNLLSRMYNVDFIYGESGWCELDSIRSGAQTNGGGNGTRLEPFQTNHYRKVTRR
ncbi:hypothetical protein TNCT_150021 [Trichonephila clavata]|uniref:Uncharacterized protein n=1 Tax=Trichonephila clavata TaxID=2740835 RepID=A0A8X6L9D6_TRICU|nr:hypothetical protein TNCT_150021 [Trichonephila clavata]